MSCCSEIKNSTSSKAGGTDDVCQMQVDLATVVRFSEYQEKRSFFFAVACNRNFAVDDRVYTLSQWVKQKCGLAAQL